MEFEVEVSGCYFEAALCPEKRPCERGLARRLAEFFLKNGVNLQSLIHPEVTDSATSTPLEVFTAEWEVESLARELSAPPTLDYSTLLWKACNWRLWLLLRSTCLRQRLPLIVKEHECAEFCPASAMLQFYLAAT